MKCFVGQEWFPGIHINILNTLNPDRNDVTTNLSYGVVVTSSPLHPPRIRTQRHHRLALAQSIELPAPNQFVRNGGFSTSGNNSTLDAVVCFATPTQRGMRLLSQMAAANQSATPIRNIKKLMLRSSSR